MNAPLVSVVIPTKNRCATLALTLEALERQAGIGGPFEVIVADDGSSDGTAEYLASRESGPNGYALRSLRLSGSGPAKARNRAIALASAPRVLLLGDDTIPASDVIARHLAAAGAEDVGVQGRIEWDPAAPVTPVMRFLAPEGHQFYFKGLEEGSPLPYTRQYGSNFSAPTRWFRDDPFDENFPAPAFEDTELAFRWRRRGRRVIYSQAAVCGHRHHYGSIEEFIQRQRVAGRAARYAVSRHPALVLKTVLQPLAVALRNAMRRAGGRLLGKDREEDAWDLRCRAAFFRGFFGR